MNNVSLSVLNSPTKVPLCTDFDRKWDVEILIKLSLSYAVPVRVMLCDEQSVK
jgi:hypothetical protein